jgi:hypothetical protein
MNLGAPASRRRVVQCRESNLAGETPALPGPVHGKRIPRNPGLEDEIPLGFTGQHRRSVARRLCPRNTNLANSARPLKQESGDIR